MMFVRFIFTIYISMMKQLYIEQMIQLFKKFTQSTQEQIKSIESQSQLIITNKESKYTLEFGEKFKDLLEPRDHAMEHEFNFIFPISEDSRLKLESNQVPDCVMENIKQILVQSASNAVSAAFKFLSDGNLQEDQAKEYASKNILLNINSIFRETVRKVSTSTFYQSIKSDMQRKKTELTAKLKLFLSECNANNVSQLLEKLEQKQQLQKIKNVFDRQSVSLSEVETVFCFNQEKLIQNLTIDFDNLMREIMTNLAGNYPQAPPTGGTPRMRAEIMDINRQQDEENDLIYANDIKISEFLQMQGERIKLVDNADYTELIMTVINKAISVTQQNHEDHKERTIAEKYQQFNQKLFSLVRNERYQTLIGSLSAQQKNNKLYQPIENTEKKKIIKYFVQILTNDPNQPLQNETMPQEEKTHQYQEKTKKQSNKKSQNKIIRSEYHHQKLQEKINETSQSEKNRKNRDLSMNQIINEAQKIKSPFKGGSKIPTLVKQFTHWQVENKQFTSKHSSILRILTKWAEYLAEIFQDPQKYILGRAYEFKSIYNKKLKLKYHDTKELAYFVRQQSKEVEQKYQAIAKNCYRLIGQFLRQQQQNSPSVCRYSHTRTVASKIRTIITEHMLIYTNTLIHHLLIAGESDLFRSQEFQKEIINLVMFRISDLLRTKLECNENSFICLLRTLYLLDADESMKGKFKLVRIKNKLDMPDNNIMINYLFMGKIQCELQLSIQEPKGKAKNYYTFSHFVYQLTRGKFGTIAQLAIMTSQLDNMIRTCQAKCYVQSRGKPILKHQGKIAYLFQTMFQKKLRQSIFQCTEPSCKKMETGQSQSLFQERTHKFCTNCALAEQIPIKISCLQQFCRSTNAKKLESYQQIKIEKNQHQNLICLSSQKKLDFYIAFRIKQELKVFLLRINQQLLSDLEKNSIDYSKVNYFDIKKKIKENNKLKQKTNQTMFLINNIEEVSDDLFELMKLHKNKLKDKIEDIIENFKKFRMQKKLIKSIKFKSEIIQVESNKHVWDTLRQLAQSDKPPSSSQLNNEFALEYKKYQHLNFSSIKQLYADQFEKQNVVSIDFSKFTNLQLLQIIKSKISNINFTGLSNLKQLQIRGAQAINIDVNHLPGLVTLNLSDNNLENFQLKNSPRLRTILLQYNKISTFTPSNSNNLLKINLKQNNLSSIDLSNCHLVQVLNVSYNKLTSLSLSNLTKLTQFHAEFNQIQSLNLPSNNLQLKQIDLNNNQISTIELNDFFNLQKANLSHNYLEHIEINNLHKLSYLYLNKNKLKAINLNNLNQLNDLEIENNHQLTTIKLNKLNHLQQISMQSTNCLRSYNLPTDLQLLTIDYHQAVSFNIELFKKLKYIRIRGNKDQLSFKIIRKNQYQYWQLNDLFF